jgi:hypothetical protein
VGAFAVRLLVGIGERDRERIVRSQRIPLGAEPRLADRGRVLHEPAIVAGGVHDGGSGELDDLLYLVEQVPRLQGVALAVQPAAPLALARIAPMLML